jgi:hypothetical protein
VAWRWSWPIWSNVAKDSRRTVPHRKTKKDMNDIYMDIYSWFMTKLVNITLISLGLMVDMSIVNEATHCRNGGLIDWNILIYG